MYLMIYFIYLLFEIIYFLYLLMMHMFFFFLYKIKMLDDYLQVLYLILVILLIKEEYVFIGILLLFMRFILGIDLRFLGLLSFLYS